MIPPVLRGLHDPRIPVPPKYLPGDNRAGYTVKAVRWDDARQCWVYTFKE